MSVVPKQQIRRKQRRVDSWHSTQAEPRKVRVDPDKPSRWPRSLRRPPFPNPETNQPSEAKQAKACGRDKPNRPQLRDENTRLAVDTEVERLSSHAHENTSRARGMGGFIRTGPSGHSYLPQPPSSRTDEEPKTLAESSPDLHASEVVAAGNNFNHLVPCAGLLQELHILLGCKTPFYLDSITTLFVVTSDTAIKRSAWLIRRVTVLEEGVTEGYIEPVHIREYDMAADPFTKYLPF